VCACVCEKLEDGESRVKVFSKRISKSMRHTQTHIRLTKNEIPFIYCESSCSAQTGVNTEYHDRSEYAVCSLLALRFFFVSWKNPKVFIFRIWFFVCPKLGIIPVLGREKITFFSTKISVFLITHLPELSRKRKRGRILNTG